MKTKAKTIFKYSLGSVISTCFFIVVMVLIFQAIPSENEKLLYTLLGVLAAKFSDIVSFFFGSSQGSSDKTDIIANGNKPKE